ncbi:recombinase RecT [Streptomyces diacarni]|uniref:recombinase RecT n=1 Tax=Streptomyces diacarni TaxID=2800381 RepID=UPI0033DEA3DB
MTLSTLKDRVRAATEERPVPTGPVQHDQAHETSDVEQAGGHDDVAADAVMTFLSRYEAHFTDALPSHVDTGAFFAAVRAVLPTLTRCTPASVLQALLTSARFGLIPDGRHAVIVRDGSLATFVPMYQGYVDLMYRSGLVESVHVGLIYEGDEWEFTPTAPAPLDFTHKPRPELPKADRGAPILAYAFAWLKGGARSQVALLNREEAEEIRDGWSKQYQHAQEAGTNDSTWHTDFNAMWQKSAIRRMSKLVPMSPELAALTDADNAGAAGTPQILHAPDPETAQLTADAERAHTAAEASQDGPAAVPLPRKRSAAKKRAQPKRSTRRGRKGRARA